MVCIDGFDDAIVGTGLRDASTEVLVYDAAIVQEILSCSGYPEHSLINFLETIDLKTLGAKAPLFIYFDAELQHEDVEQTKRRPRLKVVH